MKPVYESGSKMCSHSPMVSVTTIGVPITAWVDSSAAWDGVVRMFATGIVTIAWLCVVDVSHIKRAAALAMNDDDRSSSNVIMMDRRVTLSLMI